MGRPTPSTPSRRWLLILPLGAFALPAASEPWKDKKVPDWTEDDAKLVLSTSPWAKTVTPEMTSGPAGNQRGIGSRVPGIGYPGGMGRRRYPGGGGYPGGGQRRRDDGESRTPPTLHLRWESALPIREAELKTRDTNAPTIDENHYAVAVYGVPARMASDDSKKGIDELKKHAALKRDTKKDIKPSDVRILHRDEGTVVVFLFPRSKEITKADRRVDFEAQIGRLKFGETFFVEDMVYDGKLEL